MLVTNDVSRDARVRKEAAALRAAGARTLIVGVGTPLPGTTDALQGLQLLPPLEPSRDSVRFLRVTKNLWRLARFWRKLGLAAAATNPDFVHCHDLDTLLPGMLAAGRTGARVVYDAHELFTEQTPGSDWRRRSLHRFERWALRRVALVITVSDSLAKVIVDDYGSPIDPVVIHNYPDTHGQIPVNPAPAARKAFATLEAERVLIYQGGFSEGRGLETIIDGVAMLPAHYHLVLMGPGGTPGWLQEAMDSPDLGGRVHVWPPVPPEAVIAWAAAADAGVVTYLPDCRNNLLASPNKLYDYAAAGLPVLAADLPNVEAEVTYFKSGELFVPGSAQSFADAVLRLFDNESRLQSAVRGAVSMGMSRRWDAQALRLVEAYHALLMGA